MPRRRQVDDFKPSARLILEAVVLLKHLKEVNLPLKDLLLTLFLGLDREDELAISRRYMSTQRGWPSTLNILMAIKKAVQKKEYGRKHWDKWILSEALKIVAKEGSRRRLAVLANANRVNELSHKFFDVSRTADRYAALKDATGFLWHLIRDSIAKSRGLVFEGEVSYLSDFDAPVVGPCSKDSLKETCLPKDGVEMTLPSPEQTPNPETPLACLEDESSADSLHSLSSKSTDSGKDNAMEELPSDIGVVSDGASNGSDWGDEEAGVVYVDEIDRKESWKNRANTVSSESYMVIWSL
ncbi:hypothetical protein DFH28DRAFT_895547 [Melampsora americana]|nr:hypothetical protein DFH28DRAFT_895547 [Melampsora americana]